MLTFIWIFAALIFVGAALFVAYSANQRKRAAQSDDRVVQSQQHGAGKPAVGRAIGTE